MKTLFQFVCNFTKGGTKVRKRSYEKESKNEVKTSFCVVCFFTLDLTLFLGLPFSRRTFDEFKFLSRSSPLFIRLLTSLYVCLRIELSLLCIPLPVYSLDDS